MRTQLFLIGGGHAHLTCISNIEKFKKRNADVTLISPLPYHYYSGMGPGMLGDIYSPQEIRFKIKEMVERSGARFVEDKVVKIDPIKQLLFLESGSNLNYDFLSINVGSKIYDNLVHSNSHIIPVKPIENLRKAKRAILDLDNKKDLNFCVIGGGAAGCEIAGNLWRLVNNYEINGNVTLISDTEILATYPEKVRNLTLQSFQERGIIVNENQEVEKIEDNVVFLDNGRSILSNMSFLATGVQPNNIFGESGIPIDGEGAMIVNNHLQSIKYGNIFGGGDCINLKTKKLDKVGVYAVRENPILFHNILSSLKGKELKKFKPQSKYLLILNLGEGKGIAWRGKLAFNGKLAFRLKNYIDSRFMKKFQIS